MRWPLIPAITARSVQAKSDTTRYLYGRISLFFNRTTSLSPSVPPQIAVFQKRPDVVVPRVPDDADLKGFLAAMRRLREAAPQSNQHHADGMR